MTTEILAFPKKWQFWASDIRYNIVTENTPKEKSDLKYLCFQALAFSNEFEVDCSAVEGLLSRLKLMLIQNAEDEKVPVKASNQNEGIDQVAGSQNVPQLFYQLARNTFGPPLGVSQQSSKIKKSKFR